MTQHSSCKYPEFVITKTDRLKAIEYGFQPTKEGIRSIVVSEGAALTVIVVGWRWLGRKYVLCSKYVYHITSKPRSTTKIGSTRSIFHLFGSHWWRMSPNGSHQYLWCEESSPIGQQ